MVTRAHTAISSTDLDVMLRTAGRARVRLPHSPIEFEVNHAGVEVIFANTRYMMYQHRDVAYDRIQFRLTIDGRWGCRATQEGFGGQAHFEVIDNVGAPLDHNNPLDTTDYAPNYLANARKHRQQVLLLC